ncbi:hypothetical protein CTheo_3349 [Ceratobasidium theobromae]|uniref:Protein kinase domain-containing protein n=1 Tax=Ceratobasidium theobromae TaxID=1582974 RepID=A0A5N5QPV3_9AGAM|nr:hypothetical protein CTheo_3349 [Ceratobasidium theobromae]
MEAGSSRNPANSGGSIPVITGAMLVDEILSHLAGHNCKDVTADIDIPSCSQIAISTGGFGDVYRGALLNGTRVALKCLRVLTQRAAHELYVWSKCKHPNVLELIGVAKYRDQIAMVSPWMDNGHLSWFLSQQPQADRYTICVQIADGMAYLHHQGIVYGDMKGANILVSQDNTPKLTDFGSASMKEYTLQFTATQSQPGMSLRWTAPEIVMGDTGHSFQGDVYGLGMTMLEIITGSLPYANVRVEQAVLYKIISKVLPGRPKVLIGSFSTDQADSLWLLLTNCWEHDPKDRPTAAEVHLWLRAIAPERFEDPVSDVVEEEIIPDQTVHEEELASAPDSSNEDLSGELNEGLTKIRAEPLPSGSDQREKYFMECVSAGERMINEGPALEVPAALSFYRALRVYPAPLELITIYQKTLPSRIFALVIELTNLDVSSAGPAIEPSEP